MPSHYEEQERQLIEQYKKSPHYRDPSTYSEEEKAASDARVKELQDRARAKKAARGEDYWGTAEIRAEADRKSRVFEQGRALARKLSGSEKDAMKLQVARAQQGIEGTFGSASGLTTSDLGSVVMGDDGKLLGYRFGFDTDYVPIDQLVSEGIIEDPRRTSTTEDRPPRGIAGVDWFPSDISKYKEEDSPMSMQYTSEGATQARINEIKNRFLAQGPGTRSSMDYYNELTSLGYSPNAALQQLQQWEDEGSLIGPDPAPVQQQDLLENVPGETVQERVENFKKFTEGTPTTIARTTPTTEEMMAPWTYTPPAQTALQKTVENFAAPAPGYFDNAYDLSNQIPWRRRALSQTPEGRRSLGLNRIASMNLPGLAENFVQTSILPRAEAQYNIGRLGNILNAPEWQNIPSDFTDYFTGNVVRPIAEGANWIMETAPSGLGSFARWTYPQAKEQFGRLFASEDGNVILPRVSAEDPQERAAAKWIALQQAQNPGDFWRNTALDFLGTGLGSRMQNALADVYDRDVRRQRDINPLIDESELARRAFSSWTGPGMYNLGTIG